MKIALYCCLILFAVQIGHAAFLHFRSGRCAGFVIEKRMRRRSDPELRRSILRGLILKLQK